MLNWIRDSKKNYKGNSNVWNSLSHAFSVVNDWLVWKLGNDQQIKVAEDPMVGGVGFFKMSLDLLRFLHDNDVFYLA